MLSCTMVVSVDPSTIYGWDGLVLHSWSVAHEINQPLLGGADYVWIAILAPMVPELTSARPDDRFGACGFQYERSVYIAVIRIGV